MAKLKGAVFGFGNIGQKMTRFINKSKDAEIIAVCNRGKPRLEIAKNEYGLMTTHSAEEAMNMGIDFVVITSSNYAHKEQVLLAAKYKKHIFVEKPVATNLPDLIEMADAVDAAGVINVVNYSFRYIPAYMLLKEMIDRGDFGRILQAWNLRLREYGLYENGAEHVAVANPDESGGWTVHHTCHGIDMLYWWIGPMTRVYAGLNTTVPEDKFDSEETVAGLINFENGATGIVQDSVCIMREHHTGIIGSKASAVLTGEGENTVLKVKYEDRFESESASRKKEYKYIKTIDKKPEGVGCGHFLDCLVRGEKSTATIRDSIPSVKAARAMQESHRTGQAVSLLD